ncbi:formyl transferase [Crocinitomix catalasitica]|uniref:formyl transferase n=1 Tax=Crocinitomix catalasitica TaxID=184607 RepID=UPI00047FCF89|nr:formyl transferase [Crocinitomix catalasitica]
MSNKKALIIAQAGLTTDLLHTTVAKHFDAVEIVLEASESKKTILKRRIKKLGLSKVIGQVLFMLFAHPFIPKRKDRIKAILKDYNIQHQPLPIQQYQVNSVHDAALIEHIKKIDPDIIFINGTRIIKAKVLSATQAKFVNIHVGITPSYRGVHGGFWAIKNGRTDLFGTTLHLVDTGIDTGAIIDQIILTPTKVDNFKTYPILQYCGGLKLIEKHVEALQTNNIQPKSSLSEESHLYYHPTLLEFVR